MFILTKENLLSYIRENVPSISLRDPVTVTFIGEGDLDKDIEGDGYCNYVFRVSDTDSSYIVKQSRNRLKRRGRKMPAVRSKYEYEIMTLRSKIVPQYVPKLYYGDFENYICIMEDVSNLKLVRYQMTNNHRFPDLARQGAEYLAATHFYLSEFFLPTDQHRELLAYYMNPDLRHIMETFIFLGIFGADELDYRCGTAFTEHCQSILDDPEIKFQRYKMRHLFMSKSETLIHGDFHTSNLFADDTHLKVIDMEYTFGAPFSFDLGFIFANLIMQFCSAAFRPFPSEEERKDCLAYLISLMHMLYTDYRDYFFSYWDEDAKLEYKLAEGYKESVLLDILRECFGFAACVNFSRVIGTMETADFDMIEDSELRTKAKFLSVDIDVTLFKKWDSYNSIEEPLDDMIRIMNSKI